MLQAWGGYTCLQSALPLFMTYLATLEIDMNTLSNSIIYTNIVGGGEADKEEEDEQEEK